ncbi:MAG: DUF1772 domain-containing protein [Acidimicrobiales bacterium]
MATALGYGVMAGFFFSVSFVVMRSLGRLPAAQGIAAMQSINVNVVNPWFLGTFIGTAVASVALAIVSLFKLGEPFSVYHLVAAALYLGVIVLTGTYHIPRNDALAALDPTTAEAARYWAEYLVDWTRWNHVRALAPLAALGSLILSLRLR